jgi:hypothetical protein
METVLEVVDQFRPPRKQRRMKRFCDWRSLALLYDSEKKAPSHKLKTKLDSCHAAASLFSEEMK